MFHILNHVHDVQELDKDKRSRSQRSLSRMPFQLQDVLSRAKRATSILELTSLKKQAWELKKQWVRDMKQTALKRRVDQGSVFAKPRRLHTVSSLGVPAEENNLHWISAESAWTSPLSAYLHDKMCGTDEQIRLDLQHFVLHNDGCVPAIDPETVEVAFAKCNRKSVLEYYGVCGLALYALFLSDTSGFCSWLAGIVSSTALMSELQIKARAFGKVSSASKLTDLRVIAPLCSLLQLIDAWGAVHLHGVPEVALPLYPGIFVGARPRTQPRDIGHAVSLLIEKGLDAKSQMFLAQADVEKLYDSIRALLVIEWCILRGLPSCVAAAIIRHQLFTCLSVQVGSVEVFVEQRCIGTLTGSRIAGALGRVPVEATLRAIAPRVRRQCFRFENVALMGASFVDNVYFPARDLSSAHANAALFEQHLHDHWHQRIKPSSKSIMVCSGADMDDIENVLSDGWNVSQHDVVLGWEFFSSGSFRAAWDNLRHKLWRTYHSQFPKPGAGRVGLSKKLLVLERTVLRVLLRAVEPWPFTMTIANAIDALHRHMFACLLRLPRSLGETIQQFMKRRGRLAGSIIAMPWSVRWAENVRAWDAHLLRDWDRQKLFYHWNVPVTLTSSSFSWAAALRCHHDSSWIAGQRDTISRTNLRSIPAGVAIRWQDGLEKARKFVIE